MLFNFNEVKFGRSIDSRTELDGLTVAQNLSTKILVADGTRVKVDMLTRTHIFTWFD